MRRAYVLAVLVLGCLALAWGLFSLHGIFVDERDDALASIGARRAALEQYAHKELERRLSDRLAAAAVAMDGAARDPLLPAEEMWLVDRGQQVLPRTATALPGAATPAKVLYWQLRGPERERLIEAEQARDPGSPWGERLMLLADLHGALSAGDRAAISSKARAVLAHQASFVLEATRDIPFTLAMLQELSEKTTPDLAFMAALLRDGMTAGASSIAGVERKLLDNRARFTRADMTFLKGIVVALCERSQVLYADFLARAEEQGVPIMALPSPLDEPTLTNGGAWYLAPPQNQRVRGVKVELGSMLAEVTAGMRERVMIAADDGVVHDAFDASVPLSRVSVRVQSATWQPAIDAVHERYRLKALLELLIAVLVFGVMALGAVVFERRHRFLELKSDFVSAVSHELRTPLASIRLMAETLERRTKDMPRAKDYPARIVRDIDGLSLLVENILSFSRLSRGRWTPKLGPMRLGEVLDKLEHHKDSWARKPAELSFDGVEDVELVADSDLVQLVVTNLARNAVQYTEREPARVRVEAERSDGAVIVRVSDNGVGIPASERDKVFDDFYRSGTAKASGERGSGLGLAICRKVMEAHGGSIRVAASSSEGTTFELTFPQRGP